MSTPDPVSESLLALSQFFVGDSRLDETVQRVVDLAANSVPNAAMTGITMVIDGRIATAFCSDPEIALIDRAQYSDDGPCVTAFRTAEIVRVDSVEADARWGPFCDEAQRHGIRSTLSLPMMGHDREPVGALNFYSRRDHGFDSTDEQTGAEFSRHAAVVLANAHAYWGSHELGMRLSESQQARAVIEQAKGMLMVASDIDADRAFELMVHASQRENRKLRDIASEIVERRGRAPEAS